MRIKYIYIGSWWWWWWRIRCWCHFNSSFHRPGTALWALTFSNTSSPAQHAVALPRLGDWIGICSNGVNGGSHAKNGHPKEVFSIKTLSLYRESGFRFNIMEYWLKMLHSLSTGLGGYQPNVEGTSIYCCQLMRVEHTWKDCVFLLLGYFWIVMMFANLTGFLGKW